MPASLSIVASPSLIMSKTAFSNNGPNRNRISSISSHQNITFKSTRNHHKNAKSLLSRPCRHCIASPRAGPPSQQQQPSNLPIVLGSIAVYSTMTVGSAILGREYDLWGQLQMPVNVQGQMSYLLAMLGTLVTTTVLSDTVPGLKELKQFYKRFLIPMLREVPLWGLVVLALGAGVGEETFFRGFLQTWLVEQATHVPGTTTEIAVGAGVFSSSVIFGAAHAATPSYFIFATAAGAIFGIEYLQVGLPSTAFTHALYDFIAFVVVIRLWGADSGASKG